MRTLEIPDLICSFLSPFDGLSTYYIIIKYNLYVIIKKKYCMNIVF